MITGPLTLRDLENIARRYEKAHAASDLSAITILAIETMPTLLRDLRQARAMADTKQEAAE